MTRLRIITEQARDADGELVWLAQADGDFDHVGVGLTREEAIADLAAEIDHVCVGALPF